MRRYDHWVVTEMKDASYHRVISLRWDTTRMTVMQEAIHIGH